MAENQNIVIKDIRLKVGSKEAWEQVNPILLRGQPGYELDTYRHKVGDGTSTWSDLPYLSGFTAELRDQLELLADRYKGEFLWSAFALPIYTPTLDGPAVPTNMLHPKNRKRVWVKLMTLNTPTATQAAKLTPSGLADIADVGSLTLSMGLWSYITYGAGKVALLGDGYSSVEILTDGVTIQCYTAISGYTTSSGAVWVTSLLFTRIQDQPIPIDQDAFIGGNGELITRGLPGADGITLDIDDPRVIEHNASIGEIIARYGDVPPGTLECDGSLIAIEDYQDLANYLLSVNPSLDALDGLHVYLPDMRDRFLRGTDGSRAVGDIQEDALQNITGTLAAGVGYAYDGAFAFGGLRGYAAGVASGLALRDFLFDASSVARTADETRPKNIAIRYCIRYKSSILAGTPASSMAWPPSDGQLYGARNENWTRVMRSNAELEQ